MLEQYISISFSNRGPICRSSDKIFAAIKVNNTEYRLVQDAMVVLLGEIPDTSSNRAEEQKGDFIEHIWDLSNETQWRENWLE